MIFNVKNIKWMLLVIVQTVLINGESLSHVINELNERLETSTNIIFCKQFDQFQLVESPVSRIIFTTTDNLRIISLRNHEGAKKRLFIIVTNEPPYILMLKLESRFQNSDFLIVIDNEIEEDKWKHFFNFAWQLGYVKFIVYSLHSRIAYDKLFFPTLRIRETSIKDYANFRDFRNVEGFKVRVAAYNSIPRSFIYQDARGKTIYAGYYLRFIRAFLDTRNATFHAVYPSDNSPMNCVLSLRNNTVDLCADALVRTPNVFTISKEVRLSFANVIVPSAKPLSSFRYLSGPFKLQVWGLLLMYVILITGFLSLIHWIKSERWGFTHTLLEVFSSILNLGFHLKAIHGKERSILFGILFLSGFVFSTIYLGFLKSMLISEVFEKQIETFEELHEQNIPLLIDHYDRTLFLKLYFPEPLWAVVQSVSSETLTNRRNSFDTDYAYVMFPDRIDMFHYVQQYMRHPKFRRIKIDFCFLFAGFPMSRKWFLKHDLSRAWLHGFESGLLNKMVEDAYRETVLHGYLKLPAPEKLEAKPLGLDYFLMPALSLALGYFLALLSFALELITWKIRSILY